MPESGRLSCVGLGMLLGAHLSPYSRALLTAADHVFVVASDPLVELWLHSFRADAVSLQTHYAEGRPRRATYSRMVADILEPLQSGASVCAAFYGHPGVFAQVAHEAIAAARLSGHEASMEPGISAEDCLYADLGIDPGRSGCQHYDATQLLVYRRRLDTGAYLVLWQVGLAGDVESKRFATGAAERALLVERLREDYPADHEVIVYEAVTSPLQTPRIERMPLSALPAATVHMHSTLVVPPATRLQPDHARIARLRALQGVHAEPPRHAARLTLVQS